MFICGKAFGNFDRDRFCLVFKAQLSGTKFYVVAELRAPTTDLCDLGLSVDSYGRRARAPTARTEAAESERDEGEPNFSAVPSFEAEALRRRLQFTEAETPKRARRVMRV